MQKTERVMPVLYVISFLFSAVFLLLFFYSYIIRSKELLLNIDLVTAFFWQTFCLCPSTFITGDFLLNLRSHEKLYKRE